MVILNRAALFTEANVLLTARALQSTPMGLPAALRFWVIAWLGNMSGAYLIGAIIAFAQTYPQGFHEMLDATVAKKMTYMTQGGVPMDWLRMVVSGMLGNGMIGMAAFFANMANTLFGKYIPVFIIVSLFVAGHFQHSPANWVTFH